MANEIVNQIAHRQSVRPATNLPKAPNECICVRVGYLDVYYGLVATDANNYTYLIIDKNTVAAGQVIPPVGLEHLREWIHDLPYVNDTNDTAIPEKVYRRIADIGPADFSVYEATTGSTNPLKAHIFIPLVASAPAGAGRQTDPVKREFGHITPDPQPVKVTPQNFTEEQKAQARANIGAGMSLIYEYSAELDYIELDNDEYEKILYNTVAVKDLINSWTIYRTESASDLNLLDLSEVLTELGFTAVQAIFSNMTYTYNSESEVWEADNGNGFILCNNNIGQHWLVRCCY